MFSQTRLRLNMARPPHLPLFILYLYRKVKTSFSRLLRFYFVIRYHDSSSGRGLESESQLVVYP